ncbi:MAG: LemA family protein [Weeksellaceae bacterium]
MGTIIIIILVLLAFILLFVMYGIGIYNKLVKLRTLVEEAWSGIDVQLKKRHDLIPNLVETVKGYATHEQETFKKVTEARNQAVSANSVEQQQTAENQLNRSLMNLFAVAEQYPELKANTNFMQLQTELSSIEADIEKSRRYYNGTVREKNILIDSFPSSIIAGMFGFMKSTFFELENIAERAVPKVSF